MKRIRALIFDFDGLIIDTEVPCYQSWQEIYREYGGDLPFALWVRALGSSYEAAGFDPHGHLEQLIGQPLDRAEVEARRARRELELIEAQPVLPGVEAYISDARRLGLKLGIASSSPREWVDRHLRRVGLDRHFDVIRTSDDVGRVKPAPDLYLAALEGLGVRPDEAIALEDSPNGVTAAQEAGIFCVAVPNRLSERLPLEHADLRLASLADLPLEELIPLVEKNGRR